MITDTTEFLMRAFGLDIIETDDKGNIIIRLDDDVYGVVPHIVYKEGSKNIQIVWKSTENTYEWMGVRYNYGKTKKIPISEIEANLCSSIKKKPVINDYLYVLCNSIGHIVDHVLVTDEHFYSGRLICYEQGKRGVLLHSNFSYSDGSDIGMNDPVEDVIKAGLEIKYTFGYEVYYSDKTSAIIEGELLFDPGHIMNIYDRWIEIQSDITDMEEKGLDYVSMESLLIVLSTVAEEEGVERTGFLNTDKGTVYATLRWCDFELITKKIPKKIWTGA